MNVHENPALKIILALQWGATIYYILGQVKQYISLSSPPTSFFAAASFFSFFVFESMICHKKLWSSWLRVSSPAVHARNNGAI